MDGIGYGLDLCAGLLYEHRFAMLIIQICTVDLLHSVMFKTRGSVSVTLSEKTGDKM